MLHTKFKVVYSEKLDRNVYTLIDWIDKAVFKKHKKLFGYTDIGWTVKHPKQLCRALVSETIWTLDSQNLTEFVKNKHILEDNGQIAD